MSIFSALSYILIAIAIVASSNGCISVNIAPERSEQASNVTFVAPSPEFAEVESAGTDRTWRHNQNGNAISYVSECSSSLDQSLERIRHGVVAGINDLAMEQEESLTYNTREALRSRARGKVEGIETKLDLLVFKKNGCLYILTYVGLPDHFPKNQQDFESFIERFRAP